ncbi:MAG: hypothetical protein IJ512_02850 [Ruminococcus sp.]|nr:hypothetical protein [Ruminococcus sp.]
MRNSKRLFTLLTASALSASLLTVYSGADAAYEPPTAANTEAALCSDVPDALLAVQEAYPAGTVWTDTETTFVDTILAYVFPDTVPGHILRYQMRPGDKMVLDGHESMITEVKDTSYITAGYDEETGVYWDREITVQEINQAESFAYYSCYPDTEFEFTDYSVTLKPGETYDTYVIAPEPLTLTWRTTDTAVAAVDENGVITAVSDGVTAVSASSDTYTYYITVYVDDGKVYESGEGGNGGRTTVNTRYTDENCTSYWISDWEHDSFNILPKEQKAWFWSFCSSDLLVVTLEEGYAEAFDPSTVIEGAQAHPVSDFPYNLTFRPGAQGDLLNGSYLSELPEETTRIVKGANAENHKLYEMDGVVQVFSTSALVAEEAWAETPVIAVHTNSGTLNSLVSNFAENNVTGITEIVPYISPRSEHYSGPQSYYVTFDNLPADLNSVEYYEAVIALCKQIEDCGIGEAYPVFAQNDGLPEIPDDYRLAEIAYTNAAVDEDDTITVTHAYNTWDDVWIYPKERTDFVHRKEYDALYVLKVICTDPTAFTEEFSGQYSIQEEVYAIEETDAENCLIVADSSVSDVSYATRNWTLEEAEEAAKVLLRSENVQRVEIMDGYWEMNSSHMYVYDLIVSINSDEELSASDFEWIDSCLDDRVYLAEDIGHTEGSSYYSLHFDTTSTLSNQEEWEVLRTVMKECLANIPSVYFVAPGHLVTNAIALYNQFRFVYAVDRTDITKGSPDGDDAITVADASLALEQYARNAADAEDDSSTDAAAKLIALVSADVNGDNAVTLADASLILSYYANLAAGNEISWDALITS